MSLDPIHVVETENGPAIGRCTPVSGLTVIYGGQSGLVNYVHADRLNLSTGKDVYSGNHPGAWGKVVRTNLNFIRATDWPLETDDVEHQGSDAITFGAQTLKKVTYLDGGGTAQSST